MNQSPGIYQIVSCPWKASPVNRASLNLDQRLMFSVNSVKVRRRMISEIKPNDDTVESANLRHAKPRLACQRSPRRRNQDKSRCRQTKQSDRIDRCEPCEKRLRL